MTNPAKSPNPGELRATGESSNVAHETHASGGEPGTGESVGLAELLAAQRADSIEQISWLSKDHAEIISGSMSVATDDEHDPEGVTIAFERAQVAANLGRARARLEDLDRAMTQLTEGTYGRCERCGEPIAPERLVARPSARTCISCASRR